MDFSLTCLDDDDFMPWHVLSSSPACHMPISLEGEPDANTMVSCSSQNDDSSLSQTTPMTTAPFRVATKACLTCVGVLPRIPQTSHSSANACASLIRRLSLADTNGEAGQQRDRHLKCSGLRPCSRCVASNTECVFVASRRGCHGSRRSNVLVRHTPRQRQDPHQPGQRQLSPLPCVDTTAMGELTLPTHQAPETPNRPQSSLPGPPLPRLLNTARCLGDCGELTSGEACAAQYSDILLTSFYYYAFASHPFVLPRNYLCRFKDEALTAVIAVMRWVGSLYLSSYAAARVELYRQALKLVHDPQTPRNGFLVQAKILLVVALDGCCEQHKATRMLTDVNQLALQIRLHTRDFATDQGRSMPVLEESWRRTWWDLYLVDGMMAGVRRQSNFPLYDVAADVLLPCEEEEYLSGVIPTSLSLQAFDDSGFLEHDPSLSSFSYRILSGQNLGAMLRLPATCSPTDPAIKKMETLLTSWRLRVPAAKQDALHRNGTPDEMMFQACMIYHATSIILHQPFSRLAMQPVQAIDACAPPLKCTMHPDMVQNVHTVKMNESARAISAMVTCSVSLLSHTPFFTCALTLSSIVHLSHWALLSSSCGHAADADHGDDQLLREQIRLNMGALEKRATVWSSARQAYRQVISVARDIYQSRKEQEWIHSSVLESIPDDPFFNGQF